MDFVKITVLVKRSNAGVLQEVPALLGDYGIVQPLIEYFLEHSHARSASWMEIRLQAVQLLLEYLSANIDFFQDHRKIFRVFVQQLYSGTIGNDGLDPSRLFWRPRSTSSANRLIGGLVDFLEWMSDRYGSQQLSPLTRASRYDERLQWAAHQQRHARAFLAHTWDKAKAKIDTTLMHDFVLRRPAQSQLNGIRFFPDERFIELLFKGFVRPGQVTNPFIDRRLNLRDILITLLMHAGGVRVSEPLHLFIQDVGIDPINKSANGQNIALVRIYHPSEGIAPDDWNKINTGKRINREAYLQGKYGMKPRNRCVGRSLRAGWKTRKLDDAASKYIQVQWFPTMFGEWFLEIWKLYLRQLREIPRAHPFAFVVLHGPDRGKPLSMDAFLASHKRAIRRIGLEPAKMNGTTAHGHRHAYGQRLVDANIDVLVRRNALHHSSIESQIPYTEPTAKKVSEVLSNAMQRLEGGENVAAFDTLDSLAYGFEDVDPLGLLSGLNPKLSGTR